MFAKKLCVAGNEAELNMCNVLVALTLVVFAAAALLHGARTIFRDFCFSLLQMFAVTQLHLLFLVLITERRTQGVAHGARVLQCISLVYFFPLFNNFSCCCCCFTQLDFTSSCLLRSQKHSFEQGEGGRRATLLLHLLLTVITYCI